MRGDTAAKSSTWSAGWRGAIAVVTAGSIVLLAASVLRLTDSVATARAPSAHRLNSGGLRSAGDGAGPGTRLGRAGAESAPSSATRPPGGNAALTQLGVGAPSTVAATPASAGKAAAATPIPHVGAKNARPPLVKSPTALDGPPAVTLGTPDKPLGGGEPFPRAVNEQGETPAGTIYNAPGISKMRRHEYEWVDFARGFYTAYHNATFALTPLDGERAIAFPHQQLFAPSVEGNKYLKRDAGVGCLIGDPFVLDVQPWHMRLPRRLGLSAFNPSLVKHRGGYLVSYRVDWQGGCVVKRKGMREQYYNRTGEKHTEVVRTDAGLVPIGDSRVLDVCGGRTEIDDRVDHGLGARAVDVRLSRAPPPPGSPAGTEGPVWLTYLPMSWFTWVMDKACVQCCMRCLKNTHVAQLEIDEKAPAGAGPAAPLAGDWAVRLHSVIPLCEGLVGGRNHALFFDERGRVRAQSWLHPSIVISDVPPLYNGNSWRKRVPVTTSAPSVLRFRAGKRAPQCSHFRISGTTQLLRVRATRPARAGASAEPFDGLLGVGHLHHAHEPNRTLGIAEDLVPIRTGVAYFGSHYMHFFYLLDARPPHPLVAHSSEWCMPHSATERRCEVVQFVSGLEHAYGADDVILTYGANDCDAKAARMPLEKVLATLHWPELEAADVEAASVGASSSSSSK